MSVPPMDANSCVLLMTRAVTEPWPLMPAGVVDW